MDLDEAVAEDAVTAMPEPVVAFPEESAPPPPFTVGVFSDMPDEVYHRIECFSAGGAKTLRKSPLHYRHSRDTEHEPKDAMLFGSAVHYGVLQPELFPMRVIAEPEFNVRTNAGKAAAAAFAAEHAGKIIISTADYARALDCIKAVRAHPGARKMLDDAVTELSLFWIDREYDIPCKCRFDIYGRRGAGDLKTCQDASPAAFGRTAASFEYQAQGAHYLAGAEECLDAHGKAFVFIAAESNKPHAVAAYHLQEADILAGRHMTKIAMERYAEALNTGQWKGYADTIEPLKMPAWSRKFDV